MDNRKETHGTRRKLTDAMAILIVMALSWLCPAAACAAPSEAQAPNAERDSLTVSLVTCYPGPEIFELCGHSAIRVRGLGRDSVWNYGLFNFNEPGFVYRFVKGETDYMGAGYPFAWFLPEYEARGSRVVEQDLNLTQPEAHRLLSLLQKSALPANRTYRYNYVKNNCATKIYHYVDSALGAKAVYPDTLRYGTFRNEMRHYHRNYPWYQFGIDICLGLGIDYPLAPREEMFVPVEMMQSASGAHTADGRPLVSRTRVLVEGRPDAVLSPTPWYATPLFCSWALFVLAVAAALYDCRRQSATRWVYAAWFGILGLAGCLTAFLVFFSSHEATSPNTLILWLNPLQLLFALSAAIRRLRPLAIAMSVYDIVAMVCLLAVWPIQRQSANTAFFPLMGATLILAAAYAIIAYRKSYNNNGETAPDSVAVSPHRAARTPRRTSSKTKRTSK